MHSPYEEDLEAVYRILWYLKGILGKGLFKKNEKEGLRCVQMLIGQDLLLIESQLRGTAHLYGAF